MNKIEILIWIIGIVLVFVLSLGILWIKDEFVAFLIWDEKND